MALDKATQLIKQVKDCYPPAIPLLKKMIDTLLIPRVTLVTLEEIEFWDIRVAALKEEFLDNYTINMNNRYWASLYDLQPTRSELLEIKRRLALIDVMIKYIPTGGSAIGPIMDRINYESAELIRLSKMVQPTEFDFLKEHQIIIDKLIDIGKIPLAFPERTKLPVFLAPLYEECFLQGM